MVAPLILPPNVNSVPDTPDVDTARVAIISSTATA